jgi:hypothetical protein
MEAGREQCGPDHPRWEEKSAVKGTNCRSWQTGRTPKKPDFIGFFVVAWRLLREWRGL